MSLNSVQTYYKNLLNGYVTTYMTAQNVKPFNAFIAPPQVVIDVMEAPEIYFWGGRDHVIRHTMPATTNFSGGFKRNEWELDAYIFFVDAAAPSDNVFPLILDAFRTALETQTQERTLVDGITGQVTQLIRIADEFELDYPQAEAIEMQGHLLYTARIIVRALEDYQA